MNDNSDPNNKIPTEPAPAPTKVDFDAIDGIVTDEHELLGIGGTHVPHIDTTQLKETPSGSGPWKRS